MAGKRRRAGIPVNKHSALPLEGEMGDSRLWGRGDVADSWGRTLELA